MRLRTIEESKELDDDTKIFDGTCKTRSLLWKCIIIS